MNHLEFVIPSYALGVLVPLWFAYDATLRLRRARRRLTVLEPDRRAGREEA